MGNKRGGKPSDSRAGKRKDQNTFRTEGSVSNQHDAAFDIAYGYIKPTKIEYGNQDMDDIGNYVELNRVKPWDFYTQKRTNVRKRLKKGKLHDILLVVN